MPTLRPKEAVRGKVPNIKIVQTMNISLPKLNSIVDTRTVIYFIAEKNLRQPRVRLNIRLIL